MILGNIAYILFNRRNVTDSLTRCRRSSGLQWRLRLCNTGCFIDNFTPVQCRILQWKRAQRSRTLSDCNGIPAFHNGEFVKRTCTVPNKFQLWRRNNNNIHESESEFHAISKKPRKSLRGFFIFKAVLFEPLFLFRRKLIVYEIVFQRIIINGIASQIIGITSSKLILAPFLQ